MCNKLGSGPYRSARNTAPLPNRNLLCETWLTIVKIRRSNNELDKKDERSKEAVISIRLYRLYVRHGTTMDLDLPPDVIPVNIMRPLA